MNLLLISGIVSALFNLLGSIRYAHDVAKGLTRPHIFTWLVWCLLDLVGLALQIAEKSWGSALSMGVSLCIVGTIFVLGLRQGEKDITRGDWIALIAALAAIPLWRFTEEPLGAAILISVINTMGCWPTYRKAWAKPEEENLVSFSFFTLFAIFCVLAVSPFTLAAALYPCCMVVLNGGLTALIFLRRRRLFPAAAMG